MKTCRYAVLALLGVLITLTCLPLSAQETLDVQPGQRVRISYGLTEGQEIDGSLLGIEEDALIVSSRQSGEIMRIPFGQVREAHVLRGGKAHPWVGFGIGLAVGAGLGLAAVSAFAEVTTPCDLKGVDCSKGGQAVIATSTVIGGALGGLLGLLIKSTNWESFRVPQVQPSLQLSPDGRFGLRFFVPTGR